MLKTKLVLSLIITFLLVVPAGGAHPDYQLASILRGEAPADCQECRQLTACALLEDAAKGVYLPGRWYGWRNARQEDYDMIEWGRQEENCKRYPSFKFVGNGKDLEVWARNGWIASDMRIIAYCSKLGCTVGVSYPIEIQETMN